MEQIALPLKLGEFEEIEQDDGLDFVRIYSADGPILICDVYDSSVMDALATAEFIVKACNSHYKLVEALTTISEMTAKLSKRKYSPKHDYPMEYKLNDIAHLCNRAISKGTGKEI